MWLTVIALVVMIAYTVLLVRSVLWALRARRVAASPVRTPVTVSPGVSGGWSTRPIVVLKDVVTGLELEFVALRVERLADVDRGRTGTAVSPYRTRESVVLELEDRLVVPAGRLRVPRTIAEALD